MKDKYLERVVFVVAGRHCGHFPQWDQTLTLLSFEGGEVPRAKRQDELREDEEELGLQELDGILRWPSKKRRR
jgi:hypothetical protein